VAIAVYGGSFDPPHIAHVLATQYVLSIGEVSEVWVLPVYEHAFQKALTPFELRVEMCCAAFQNDARVHVSELERQLPRPNFTLNTLEAIRSQRPGEELRLIVGADVIADSKNWHRFEEVEALAPPLVLGRAGVSSATAPPAVLPEVSSTEIRQWFASGEKVAQEHLRRLVPETVRRIAERESLYK